MASMINVFKVFAPATVAFFLGILITPVITHYLYKYKLWKKKSGKLAPDGKDTPIFNSLHASKEVGTPRMGGIIIWGSVLLTTFFFWLASQTSYPTLEKLNFLSRNQTWLPLFVLITASLVGLIDDWFLVSGRPGYIAGGLSFKKRLLVVILIGLLSALWFFFKLERDSIFVPFWGSLSLGIWFIPFFILVTVTLFGSGVIDGLDGLAGGIMAIIFGAYAGIAFFQEQIDLAALSAVIAGGSLAFLWFNIPPARFYMSETGMLGLTMCLAVVAFLTNSVVTLPLIALPLTATVISNIIQLASKKLRQGKKVFLVAPLHHHFEAIGWPAHKVVMRYWVIGTVAALLGMIITLIGK